MAVKIKINNVRKEFTNHQGNKTIALNGVNLDIMENEFVCVVGPSGCGKTTLLNILAGLEKATSGEVTINGEPIVGPGNDRGVIFQQYALFPWLTVRQNISYGLRFKLIEDPQTGKPRHLTKEEKAAAVDKYMKMVNLYDFANSYPKELSGGMKQRVAIARGYAISPEVLLMDEPFGALDAQTRAQLQEDLLMTWENEKKTCFFITHDVEEAVLLATRVVVMSARPGRVKDIIDIDLPYPRNQATKLLPEFNELKNKIWGNVYQEYLEVQK
ncbi:MAG: ABC transporter ATP-binding protein [Candidatus Ornithospirochaeta sp.]|nr:ABC transporter ATP-binding protein [Candidatus Ornithospirochaeta sp.]